MERGTVGKIVVDKGGKRHEKSVIDGREQGEI